MKKHFEMNQKSILSGCHFHPTHYHALLAFTQHLLYCHSINLWKLLFVKVNIGVLVHNHICGAIIVINIYMQTTYF